MKRWAEMTREEKIEFILRADWSIRRLSGHDVAWEDHKQKQQNWAEELLEEMWDIGALHD